MSKINVLITGGASGLGRTIAEFLIKKGLNIYVIDKIPDEQIDYEYYKKLNKYYKLDLNDLNSLRNLLYKQDFPIIDVLFNIAAIRKFKAFHEFNLEEIQLISNVNVNAILILTNIIAKKMIEKKRGKIINIGSRAGFYGYSTGSLYTSTKSFLIRFTESIANDFKKITPEVTANIICPAALTDLAGTKLSGYNKQIRKILKYIDKILSGKINGKCFNCFSFKEKMFFLYINIKNLF